MRRDSFRLTPPDRVIALSEQLAQVHQTLQDHLVSLRRQLADGAGHTDLSEDLLSHCLSFCAIVHTHHTGENGQLLPALRAAAPGLAPVIGKLIEDHHLVAGILQQVRTLLRAQSPADPAALVRQLDGLAAILESHFSYEERRIAEALDALGPEAWAADVFDPGGIVASGRMRHGGADREG